MLRELYRAVLAGLLGCAILLSKAVHAAGLLSAPANASMTAMPQWPVLRNQAQSVLGLYGGIVSAHALGGQLESATLLILPTGYMAPLLSGGALATFPVAYFDQPGCKGREYLSPSGNQSGLLPFPGAVYRSAASGQPSYIPQGRQPSPVRINSRLNLDVRQGILCESLQETLPLLAVEPNAPTVTGISRDGDLGPVTLGIESAPSVAGKRDRRGAAGAVMGASGGEADVPDQPQVECSPGCLTEVVGNGICDVACYFESCSFDGGDCAAMNKDELDKAMANMCSPGCNREDIGDGFCDVACQTPACNQDGGDCDQNSR